MRIRIQIYTEPNPKISKFTREKLEWFFNKTQRIFLNLSDWFTSSGRRQSAGRTSKCWSANPNYYESGTHKVLYGVGSPKFGLLCTAVLIGWDPPTPLPLPRILCSYTRALLVSRGRQHLFVTPWESEHCVKTKNTVSSGVGPTLFLKRISPLLNSSADPCARQE